MGIHLILTVMFVGGLLGLLWLWLRRQTGRMAGRVKRAQAGAGDDLTRIKGIGPVIADKLHALGINSYAQIAAFSAEDMARVDAVLDFKGRMEREQWVGQARRLVAGKT